MTFHLTVGDVLASVDRYNAFLVSIGTLAHGVKVVPGGTTFAGQTCAGFGSVFQLGSVAVLQGPAALPARAPSRHGKTAAALGTVFGAAGVRTWTPPATDVETDVPFWSAAPVADGAFFAAAGMTSGSDDGLLTADAHDGILRFRADVNGSADIRGRYRFLLEIRGRTSSRDGALVAAGESRCFTFVDLAPVDLAAFRHFIDANVVNPRLSYTILRPRLDVVEAALAGRDTATAIAELSVIAAATISHSPDLVPLATARVLAEFALRVRHAILFAPADAACGNGVRETSEACDGGDLGGFTCASLGFGSGSLACTADCHLDTSGCVSTALCGNGIVEPGEECDNGAANSDTVPDACRTNCKRAYCGDAVIDFDEECEGTNLAGETCASLGYSGGTLRCDASACEFDEDRCVDR